MATIIFDGDFEHLRNEILIGGPFQNLTIEIISSPEHDNSDLGRHQITMGQYIEAVVAAASEFHFEFFEDELLYEEAENMCPTVYLISEKYAESFSPKPPVPSVPTVIRGIYFPKWKLACK